MNAARSFLIVFCAVLFSNASLAKPSKLEKPAAVATPSGVADAHYAHYFASQAEHLAKLQLYEEAAASMEKAIKLEPANIDFHARKSDFIFLGEDDDEEALREIDRALSLTRTPPPQYLSKKAGILERLRRFPEALSYINKVLASKDVVVSSGSSEKQRKQLAFFLGQRASIEKCMGRLQDAENDLAQAIKHLPNSSDMRIRRAQVSSELKHWSTVITDASFVIETNYRGSPLLRKREAYLMLASAYVGMKNFEKAKSTYLAALKECRDDRIVISGAQKYFASIGDIKTSTDLKKRLNSLDEDFVPFR